MARYSSDNFMALNATNLTVAGSVVVANKLLSYVGIGSPTTWGSITQAGSNATGAGSNAWVSYGTAFSSAPYVNATSAESTEAIAVDAGSVAAGSFYVETKTASQVFAWTAIGPE